MAQTRSPARTSARRGTVLCLAGSFAIAAELHAAPPPIAVPVSEQGEQGANAGAASFLSQLKRSNFLLGDLFGLRDELSRLGLTLAIEETSEVLGNTSGGTRTGADYDGLTQVVLQLDTQRAFGHYGGLFNASMLQIHGKNLSADNLSTLQTASGIEADRATRLWELWYDQKLLEEDRLDLRIGLESADQEFIVSSNALYFVNTMFGWPALPSYDLPGGGPAYPLSAPAVRVRVRPVNSVTLLMALFNGSPVNRNLGDPQQENASGTSFPVHGGALAFTELQFAYPSLGSMVYPGESAPLSRTYKLGAWFDSERFSDERFDTHGVPLANPLSNGVAATHRGNLSLYGVADQMLWRNGGDPNQSVSGFLRVMGTPDPDRNLIAFSANAGIILHEPFRYRPDDTLGFGMGTVRVSHQVAAFERDLNYYGALATGTVGANFAPGPIQGSETYLEATYQRQIRPWWQIQPDIQYVFNPGGGTADPNTGRPVRNEFVIGLRTNILF
jgi:porin